MTIVEVVPIMLSSFLIQEININIRSKDICVSSIKTIIREPIKEKINIIVELDSMTPETTKSITHTFRQI